MKIFLLEDDMSLTDALKYSLEKNGYGVSFSRTLRAAKESFNKGDYDLYLLDVTLPDGTGFEMCEHIRAAEDFSPIIFLTASDEELNVIRALDSGGDDYVTKPFKLGELLSRIRAVSRRAYREKNTPSRSIELDGDSLAALKNGERIDLTGAEYRLLRLFMKNSGRTLTRGSILSALWDDGGNFVDDNTLSVYIRRLREKIEDDPSSPRFLVTVRGLGYKWNDKSSS